MCIDNKGTLHDPVLQRTLMCSAFLSTSAAVSCMICLEIHSMPSEVSVGRISVHDSGRHCP